MATIDGYPQTHHHSPLLHRIHHHSSDLTSSSPDFNRWGATNLLSPRRNNPRRGKFPSPASATHATPVADLRDAHRSHRRPSRRAPLPSPCFSSSSLRRGSWCLRGGEVEVKVEEKRGSAEVARGRIRRR
ncbi:hypothetical protein Droror1_Dr00006638 [Drosera rotundifolia]